MAAARGERLASIDVVRGAVMVLMALDHVRDYFGDITDVPENLATTTPALFATRWITHFCAPVFVFLAGTAAFLYGATRSRGELARFLFTRGLWLIVLEFTVVHFGWILSFSAGVTFLQVIAAIGIAMLALSALVFLPLRAVAAVGLAIVCGQHLLDGVAVEPGGFWATVWGVLFVRGSRFDPPVLPLVIVIYPVFAWIGVMASGYAFGALVKLPRERRRKLFVRLGLALAAAFLLLRGSNLYGDPVDWEAQDGAAMTVVAFLNCAKYPPSLCFLLMTLGPAILFLGLLDREPGAFGRALATFGRVPLFYYVVHITVISVASLACYYFRSDVVYRAIVNFPPEDYGNGLPVVYAVWVAVVLLLYPVCRWYAGVKRRSGSPILSYL